MALERLRLVDFSDRELLLILNDVTDAEGWGTAVDMVVHMDFAPSVEHPQRYVGSRLGWLYRYGAVEREHMYDEHNNPRFTKAGKPRFSQRWRLTPIGAAVAMGRLKAAQQRTLEGLADDQLLVAMREITRLYRQAPGTAAALVKREWTYGSAPERNSNGG